MNPWIIITLAAAGVVTLISGPMINAYNLSLETQQIAHQLMLSISIIIVFRSTNSLLTKGVLRAGGDTRFLMVADVLFLWIASIPLGALAAFVWELPAVMVFEFLKVDQVIKCIWCFSRLRSGKWQKTIERNA